MHLYEQTKKMPGATWQQYVDESLVNSGFVNRAAICGLEKGQIWAVSRGFDLNQNEVKAIIKGFIEPEVLRASGVKLGDRKYELMRTSGDTMVAKSGQNGCVIVKCKQLVIIGVYEDVQGGHPSHCYSLVCKLGDYLKHQGF